MSQGKIVVIGSSNTDMVIKSAHLPKPGETVLGGKFVMNPGGKGANQAVVAAKLDGDVTFIARVGNDVFGQEAIKGFRSYGINTEFVGIEADSPSGVALIMVDAAAENSISVALGANATMKTSAIDTAKAVFSDASFVLIQLEIPISVVEYVAKMAEKEGVPVVLNPAPAQELSDAILASLYMITPNESEAELLTGVSVIDEASARNAAKQLKMRGVDIVVITMGSQGAYVFSDEEDRMIPSPRVNAVDTTAAGDTFNGALVVGLSEGMPLVDAIIFANEAAAFSVTRMGAQASAPSRSDIN